MNQDIRPIQIDLKQKLSCCCDDQNTIMKFLLGIVCSVLPFILAAADEAAVNNQSNGHQRVWGQLDHSIQVMSQLINISPLNFDSLITYRFKGVHWTR